MIHDIYLITNNVHVTKVTGGYFYTITSSCLSCPLHHVSWLHCWYCYYCYHRVIPVVYV